MFVRLVPLVLFLLQTAIDLPRELRVCTRVSLIHMIFCSDAAQDNRLGGKPRVLGAGRGAGLGWGWRDRKLKEAGGDSELSVLREGLFVSLLNV